MRVLYMTGESLDKHGGTPVRIKEIAAEMVALGAAVFFLAPSYGGRKATGWPGRVYSVCLPGRNYVTFGFYELTAWLWMAWALVRSRADVVLSTGGLFSPMCYVVCKLLRRRFVVEVNGVADEEASRYRVNRVVAQLYAWIYRYGGTYRFADAFICVAPGITEELTRRWAGFAGKGHTICNGVNEKRFGPQDARKCRQELGLPTDVFVFGFVGLLAAWHGVEQLVRAAALLRARGTRGFIVVIVGDGVMSSSLKRQVESMGVQDLVLFAGRVSHDLVLKYTGAFDVACLTHNDATIGRLGNSMKFWEYLATGLPVIVSDMSEASRHVRAGLVGWKYAGADPAALADAMEYCIGNRQECSALAASNRAFIEHGHRWHDVAEEMLCVLRGERPSGRTV